MVNCKRETVSLIPEFELGLWNAWIFMVPSLLLMLLWLLVMTKKRAPAAGMRLSKTKLSFCLFPSLFILQPWYTLFSYR